MAPRTEGPCPTCKTILPVGTEQCPKCLTLIGGDSNDIDGPTVDGPKPAPTQPQGG